MWNWKKINQFLYNFFYIFLIFQKFNSNFSRIFTTSQSSPPLTAWIWSLCRTRESCTMRRRRRKTFRRWSRRRWRGWKRPERNAESPRIRRPTRSPRRWSLRLSRIFRYDNQLISALITALICRCPSQTSTCVSRISIPTVIDHSPWESPLRSSILR